MDYIKNILSDELAEELENFLVKHPWQWGFPSNSHMEGTVPHWSIIFGGISKSGEKYYNCENELNGIIKTIWEIVKLKFFVNDILIRCYANAITKGIDQRVHTDDQYSGSKTLILYVNKIWNIDWAGETIVWDRDIREIVGSYFPKFNHGLLIDGNSWHGVRPISTYCNNLRMTLMFKTRPKTYLGEINAAL